MKYAINKNVRKALFPPKQFYYNFISLKLRQKTTAKPMQACDILSL